MQRLKAISRLEQELSRVVLAEESGKSDSSSKMARQSWWDAQHYPRTCIALSLVHLVHRLHLECQPDGRGKCKDLVEGDVICGQFIGCFTILQGLCLKDNVSQQICSRKGTIELLLDIIGANYWMNQSSPSNAPAYALDLLICITISSPSASKLVESLQGEEIVRSLMERHTTVAAEMDGKEQHQKKAGNRRAVTLNQVQDSPFAIKCAEFLLFFEYEREEPARQKARLEVAVDESIILNDSFQSAINQSFQKPNAKEERKEGIIVEEEASARSKSPVKVMITEEAREAFRARKEEKVQAIRSRSHQSSKKSDVALQKVSFCRNTNISTDLALQKKPISSTKTSLTPFAKAMSPRKARGRTRSRSPLRDLHQPPSSSSSSLSSSQYKDQHSTLLLSTMPTSPLKAIMGPSPAVQRARARSMSPIKMSRHAGGQFSPCAR